MAGSGVGAKRRSYNQYCAVAYGLDVIGERWTLLVVRELLLGPKRFTDLFEALPGIASNLLTARLRELQRAGLVERSELPPPSSSSVYQLSGLGQELEPVVRAVGGFGARFISGEPRADEALPPNAYMLALRTTFQPEQARGLARTYEVELDRHVFGIEIENGVCTTWEGRPNLADLGLATDVRTFSALLWEHLAADEAVKSGRLILRGPMAELRRFVRIFAHRRRRSSGYQATASFTRS